MITTTDTAPILVVGPAWVGDMVMAQALFLRLKTLHPRSPIDVLAPAWSLPIIARMPEVRAGIELPFAHGELNLAGRRKLGLSLIVRQYEQAIVLPNSYKSALVPYFAHIPRRTGYKREFRYGVLNDLRRLDKDLLKTTPQRFVALADDGDATVPPVIPTPRLLADTSRARKLRDDLALPEGPTVALMPGAEYGPAKQWPAAHFGELAKALKAQGITSWIIGSAKERSLGEEIVYASEGAALNLAGKTALVDVIDLVSLCGAVVTNDSGPMHIAAATGVPVVAIYGSSTPDHTPPLTETKAIHYLRVECSPCFERTCPLKTDRYKCLTGITPQDVMESVVRLMG